MASLKEYMREVRDAAAAHLEARHGDLSTPELQQLPREEALATIAIVTIRLLEQQLQEGHVPNPERSQLEAQLKTCRKALKADTVMSPTSSRPTESHETSAKRHRTEDAKEQLAASQTSSSAAADKTNSKEAVELGQYSSSDAFGQNAEKRLKFSRLMGGAKAAEAQKAAHAHHHHNTHAKSSAEVRHMNESLESQYESAMSHKGKKGLGA